MRTTEILGMVTLVLIKVYSPTLLKRLFWFLGSPTCPLLLRLFAVSFYLLGPFWLSCCGLAIDPPFNWNLFKTSFIASSFLFFWWMFIFYSFFSFFRGRSSSIFFVVDFIVQSYMKSIYILFAFLALDNRLFKYL